MTMQVRGGEAAPGAFRLSKFLINRLPQDTCCYYLKPKTNSAILTSITLLKLHYSSYAQVRMGRNPDFNFIFSVFVLVGAVLSLPLLPVAWIATILIWIKTIVLREVKVKD